MTDPDAPFTLAFVGHADPEVAERASAYEDRVLPLLADHGARLLYRGRRVAAQDPSLPLEVHLTWFPHRRALAAYMADPRRQALIDEFGEVFTTKQVVELDPYPGGMSDIDLLSDVLDKTGDVIAGVGPDQLEGPTPCPGYDVRGMVDHLVGWMQAFEAGANGRTYDGDPSTVRAGDDPAGEFRAAAAGVVAGWREHGVDREVTLTGSGAVPGSMLLNMTLMEDMTHGWDLAIATDQRVPYTEAEAEEVLARAQATLPAQYRGEGMPFGDIVPVPDDAPAVDRLAGFMGRDPGSA